MPLKYTPEDIERFWSKVDTSKGEDSCWVWKTELKKSPQFQMGNKSLTAPRVSYEITYGDISEEVSVRRSCKNKFCVNPKHLYLGSSMKHYSTKNERIVAFWSKVDRSGGEKACWIWSGTLVGKQRSENIGYGTVHWIDGKKLATHVMYELAYGIVPGELGLDVLHKCDNPRCVNPSHLFLGTHQDNMSDMKTKGRGTRKVTDLQVEEIRRRVSAGETCLALAFEFGLSVNYTRSIASCKSRT